MTYFSPNSSLIHGDACLSTHLGDEILRAPTMTVMMMVPILAWTLEVADAHIGMTCMTLESEVQNACTCVIQTSRSNFCDHTKSKLSLESTQLYQEWATHNLRCATLRPHHLSSTSRHSNMACSQSQTCSISTTRTSRLSHHTHMRLQASSSLNSCSSLHGYGSSGSRKEPQPTVQ